MIIYIIFSVFVWLLAAMAFEYGFSVFRRSHSANLQKDELCKIYWGAIALLGFVSSGAGMFPQILSILPVAASHIDLSRSIDDPIPLREIVRNIGTLASQGVPRIANQVKSWL